MFIIKIYLQASSSQPNMLNFLASRKMKIAQGQKVLMSLRLKKKKKESPVSVNQTYACKPVQLRFTLKKNKTLWHYIITKVREIYVSKFSLYYYPVTFTMLYVYKILPAFYIKTTSLLLTSLEQHFRNSQISIIPVSAFHHMKWFCHYNNLYCPCQNIRKKKVILLIGLSSKYFPKDNPTSQNEF